MATRGPHGNQLRHLFELIAFARHGERGLVVVDEVQRARLLRQDTAGDLHQAALSRWNDDVVWIVLGTAPLAAGIQHVQQIQRDLLMAVVGRDNG